MPVTVKEQFGRQVDGNRAEKTYVVRGTSDEIEARTELLAESPAGLDSGAYVRDNVDVNEIRGLAGFIGTVSYRRAEAVSLPPKEPGESSFNFDTGGATQRIFASKATVAAYGADASIADNGKLIGVTDQGVEGADIVIPQFQFTETHVKTPAEVDNAYKAILFGLTGRTNDASFKGLNEGECLFLGASGAQRGDDNWEIQYRFAGSANVTGLAIGGISGINKGGWEYLWIRYVDGDANGITTRVPERVYVERVYDPGDFSTLGIGT